MTRMTRRIFFSVILLLGIIGADTLFLFFNPLFYHQQYVSNDVQVDGLWEKTIELYGFFLGGELESFSTDEIRHMEDVRLLLWTLFGMTISCFSLLFLFLRPEELKPVFGMTLVLSIIILALGIIALLSFSAFFKLFHQLFFVDNWQFPAESLLIQMFPETFFMNGLCVVIGQTVVKSGFGYYVLKE